MNIIEIYKSWLEHNQDINTRRRYLGKEKYFQASSAGSCFKKQLFKYQNIPSEKDFDDKTMRVFRLGTILHDDFEQAIKHHMLNNISSQQRYIIFLEKEVINESLNVRGHLDFAYIDRDSNTLTVADLKSAKAYQWQKKFGQIKNRDKNPTYQYEMQVGTYADALNNIYEDMIDEIKIQLIWYKKDDSSIKTQIIDTDMAITMATEYWEGLNEIVKDNDVKTNNGTVLFLNNMLRREKDYGVPFTYWECNYCQWEKYCK